MIDPQMAEDFVPDRITRWKSLALYVGCLVAMGALYWFAARVLL